MSDTNFNIFLFYQDGWQEKKMSYVFIERVVMIIKMLFSVQNGILTYFSH